MALTRAQIHTNALYICSKLDYPSDHQELSELHKEVQLPDNDDNILFTYGAYYRLLSNAIHEVGVNPIPQQTGYRALSPSKKECVNKLLCYVWHMIAGPIHHYLDNPLFEYWFHKMDDFYTTASNFLKDEPGQLTNEQTALIPWVQSIVIQHYVLGKEVFFQGQDNYIDLYQYLDDFIALYLTLGLNRTIGDDIQQCPEYHTYSESDHHPNTIFIHREYINWGPEKQPSGYYDGFLCSYLQHGCTLS